MAYLAEDFRPEVPPMTQSPSQPMIQPVFILVRPQMGENIGAAARAMLTTLHR